MKENDIREDMNGIKSEILRDDEERKKDQLKRLQAYVEAIQKKVSSHTDEVVKELVAERHRQGLPSCVMRRISSLCTKQACRVPLATGCSG